MVTDRIVVLRRADPFSFIADGCAALAQAVNEPHAWSTTDDDLVGAYAAMVRAYAALLRPAIGNEVQLRIVDHLLDRLGEAERGDFPVPIVDIVDRLHAELTPTPALS
jgi:hypothetical protein